MNQTIAEPAANSPPPSNFRQRALHIVTLCGFAFTQPVLFALMKQTVFLHDEQIGWPEVAVLLTLLLLILPAVAVGLDVICGRLSRRTRGFGRKFVFAGLTTIIMLSLVRPALGITWIAILGFGGLVSLIVSIPCSWLLARMYEKQAWVRSWMTFASVGLLMFPTVFLWQFHTLRNVETRIESGIPVAHRVPVILVVFDELSGITLMNEQMELDSDRFPQFARLAQRSTWYRNATTVHPRTQIAVPAILSGQYPTQDLPPLESQYPGNLLQLIESTKAFDMAVFEAATRLCPMSVGRSPLTDKSFSEKAITLIHTLSAVYPRLIFANDVPAWFPKIPMAWFGFTRRDRSENSDPATTTEGLFNYFSTASRDRQFVHFLNCVRSSESPRFVFYHTVFPHFPWSYLPTGEQYEIESAAPAFPAGASGELGEDWRDDPNIILRNEFRYRLQVGFTDRMIGQLLDRLEETELLDRCLLIVMADHGVSFRSGHSRRLPDNDTLAEILSIPLFIKLPGQTEGRTDDRNVESVDILPTITEVLGIELPHPVDGIPVSSESSHLRKTVFLDSKMTIVEPAFPQRKAALERQARVFGQSALTSAPAATAVRPEWHGRAVNEFATDTRPIRYLKVDPLKSTFLEEQPNHANFVNCFVTGRIPPKNLPAIPSTVVLALDGIIIDTQRTYPVDRRTHGFEFLLSKPVTGDNKVEVFIAELKENDVRFRLLVDEPAYHEFIMDE